MSNFDARTQPLKGRHSIEASAGTGKTFSITLLWLRLLVEQNLGVEQVLVSTFTRAATAELKERLLASLRRAVISAKALEEGASVVACEEARIIEAHHQASKTPYGTVLQGLSKALSGFDLAPISTIHSFCQSLLSRHALELGSDSMLKISQDSKEALEEIRDDSVLPLTDFFNPDPELLGETAKHLESHPSARVQLPNESLDELRELWFKTIEDLRAAEAAFAPKGKSKSLLNSLGKIRLLLGSRIWMGPIGISDERVLSKEAGGPVLFRLYEEAGILKRQIETFDLCHRFRPTLALRKNRLGSRSMNDLVYAVYEALQAGGEGGESALARSVRNRISAAIIDECQDSDLLQIEVFKTIFSHPSTVSFIVIGDPKQSIYRFRGADLASYKNLASSAAQAPQMTVNYRSDQALVECLNALYSPEFEFPDSRNPGAKTLYVGVTANAKETRITDPAYKKPLVFFFTPSQSRNEAVQHLAVWCARECARLLASGTTVVDRHTGLERPLQAGDIAVLASAHRELRLCREQLNSLGIPCQSSGNGLGSVYESSEAQDVLAWLELLSVFKEGGEVLTRLCTFLGTPLGGMPPEKILEFRRDASAQAKRCSGFQDDLAEFQRSGPLPLLLRLLARSGVADHSLGSAEGERLYTNWRQIGALLQREFAHGRRSPASLAVWLSRRIASPDDQSDQESEESDQMRLETDAPAVQLTTIHGSKGLEYPVVFCPFLWSVRSRPYRRKAKVAIFRGEDGWGIDAGSRSFGSNLETALLQEDEEEHRKLYVALTRPRHRLYLGVAAIPPPQKGTDYENSSAHSAFAKLPGLGLGDPLEWEGVLSSLPWAEFVCAVKGLPALPKEGLLKTAGSKPSLAPAPARRSYSYPFSAKRSFSSLSKSDQDHQVHAADRDHSQGGDGEERKDAADLLQPLGDAGNILGDQMHHALENFLGNRMELNEAVAGLERAPAWESAIREIVETPLALGTAASVTLAGVRDGCITEMQFQMPVDRLDPSALSSALAEDNLICGNSARSEWAKHLASLKFSDFTGFLQGFIDLIFEHEGRWYVADYKSNKLKGYDQGSLEAAMIKHNYLLQARIYNLALHRHLSHHLAHYDYDRDFGGVAYLFVRGFPKDGVWFERPDLASVERFGRFFQHHSSP